MVVSRHPTLVFPLPNGSAFPGRHRNGLRPAFIRRAMTSRRLIADTWEWSCVFDNPCRERVGRGCAQAAGHRIGTGVPHRSLVGVVSTGCSAASPPFVHISKGRRWEHAWPVDIWEGRRSGVLQPAQPESSAQHAGRHVLHLAACHRCSQNGQSCVCRPLSGEASPIATLDVAAHPEPVSG